MNTSMKKKNQIQNEKNLQKQKNALAKDIMLRIKDKFEHHRLKVDRMNQDQTFGGNKLKNDKSDKIYLQLHDFVNEIKQKILKNIRSNQKLRKERKQMYQGKMARFVQILQQLSKKKSIKIKINESMQNLIQATQKIIQEATKNLKMFQKQSNLFCGKAHDYKLHVQRSMTQLSEYAFLWENISNFESVTNDSVKQIYLPVQYDQNAFKDIQKDIQRLWPKPVFVEKQVKVQVQVPVNIPQPPQISDLSEVHQLYFGFTRPQQTLLAFQKYKQQSQKKNPNPIALNALGSIYQNGIIVPKDLKKSLNYYLRSSKMNNPEGLYKIGWFLQKGIVNTKQIFEGLYNNRQSQIRGGIQYYQKAAKLQHLDAITDLGFIYENGIKNEDQTDYFIPPYEEVAVKYYMKGKKADFPRALNNLGSLLVRNPKVVEEQTDGSNLQKGIKYLQRAVQLRYPKAYVNLGKCYQNGVGVYQNIDKARSLYLQGSKAGQPTCRLEYIKTFLGEKIEDQKYMIKLCELCKQMLLQDPNNMQANYFMGLFAQKGIGTQKNKESSFYYISKAASLGYSPAIVKLGDYYYSGYHVDKNYQFARQVYEKAVQKGNTQALVNLGVMIQKGIISTAQDQNPAQTAKSYYQQAARLGNANAVLLLGLKNDTKNINQQSILKAVQLGSIQAAHFLSKTQAKLVPKKPKQTHTYQQILKKRSSFYCKENAQQRSTLKSFSRSKREKQ